MVFYCQRHAVKVYISRHTQMTLLSMYGTCSSWDFCVWKKYKE